MSDALTERIIGAAIEVHRHLGPGLLESIYEEALCHELNLRGLEAVRQLAVDVRYKGIIIKGQRLALLVESEVVVKGIGVVGDSVQRTRPDIHGRNRGVPERLGEEPLAVPEVVLE